MAGIFDIDLKDQKELMKFFNKFPKQARYATAGVLNNFAFGSRTDTIKNFSKENIVRNKSFVSSSTRVNRAKGNTDINRQSSEMGFVSRGKSSGFVEQELGTKTRRDKTINPSARGGSMAGKVRKRFKTGIDMNTPNKTGLSNNIGGFLQYQKRQRNEAFLLTKRHKGLGKGVYIYKGSGNSKQLIKLQNLSKRVQPKKKPVLLKSSNQYVKKINLSKLWEKQVTKQLLSMIEYQRLRK